MVDNVENKNNVKEEVKDFKVAEIWIRSGQVMLDASESFWASRCNALGLLELCKEIVLTAKAPEAPRAKIIPGTEGMVNGLKRFFGKHRRN